MKVSSSQLANFAQVLRDHVSGDVLLDHYQCALYATDASIYQIQPVAVVLPRHRDDVVSAMQAAAEFGIPVIPRGGGTSLSGQAVGAGMVLDFSKYMTRIVEFDTEQRTARVEPGVVLDTLNATVRADALQFGPDVSTSNRANMGGMIGNNSAGARSVVHGRTVDHVISLDVVTAEGQTVRFEPLTEEAWRRKASGDNAEARMYREVDRVVAAHRQEIIDRFPRTLRRVSGYNLDEFIPDCRSLRPTTPSVELVRAVEAERFPNAHYNLSKLVVGAEGTLATAVEALVHLVPLPSQRGILVLEFDTLAGAVDAVGPLLECGPSAVEIFDRMILDLAAANVHYRNYLDFVTGEPESLILAEFTADSPGELQQKLDRAAEHLRGARDLSHMMPATDQRLADHIWACRKAALPLLMGIPGQRKPIAFVEDTAVPPERLPEFVARFREIVADEGTTGAFYGHASVGCLHIRPLIDTASRDDLERMKRILDRASDLVLEFGGAMSGEHGDGLARSYLNEKLFGRQLYQAFKEVKAAFDPQNLLNPGKVVDGPAPDENLRHFPDQKTLPVDTAFDFSNQGGFAPAAALCNGSGVCRKMTGGTMCPSFMATADEEHSTRGRANALRLVLNGALPPEELTGSHLYGTYDLCLQCKGCKAECPSNVDVAKLKAEFLNQYHRVHGVPGSVRRMAHVAKLNRLGSAFAPVSNWVTRLPGMPWLMERLAGVDHRRSVPPFHRNHFRRWFRRRPRQRGVRRRRGKIVLLDDCLTSYCEPEVNRSAVEVLEAAGYEVILADLECCGRPLISKGLLDEAKELVESNLAHLLPYAKKEIPIVGCEPSCLLTLVDEYPELVPGESARRVAEQSRLIETQLVNEKIDLPLRPHEKRVLLHGHCHQKALVGAEDSKRVLEMIPGLSAELLNSGCCGMAGSFGYEHYDLSMKIGELVLFPAVRNFDGAAICAPGFSCRHQIADGTDRLATHPVQQLASHLQRPPREGDE